MARRKTLTDHIEGFFQRMLTRHVAQRDWAAVEEDFAWLGQFHEKHNELEAQS